MAASFFDNKARARLAAEASSSKPKSATANGAPRLQPWVEKYRPKTLEDVKSQDHVTSVLRKMVNASNLPHLMLYGPPGTGKTSTMLALCRELYGPELFSSRVLELNASDERGISVVRERIKTFAQQSLIHAPASKEYREKYPCPPFKIIILDEADSLTQDSQSALRRVMENYAAVTRIAFCCNYITRMIDPLSSRCSKFRFKTLDGGDAKTRIEDILRAENVDYDEGVVELTLKIADGDLRRALQMLQSAARLVGASSTPKDQSDQKPKRSVILDDDDDDDDQEMTDADALTLVGKPITKEIINEISGIVPPKITEDIISSMQKGSARNYQNLSDLVSDIVASGYSANEVLSSLYTALMWDDTLDSKKKIKILPILSQKDKDLGDGAEEHLVMLDMILQIASIMSTK